LPYCLPHGKAGGLQILCCQGIKVADYNFTLDALALKPSDFCNVRVISPVYWKNSCGANRLILKFEIYLACDELWRVVIERLGISIIY
jgi:hypothetical protein